METAVDEMKKPGFITLITTTDARLLGKKWGLLKATKEYESAFAKIDEDYANLERYTEVVKAKKDDFHMLFGEAQRLKQEYLQLLKQRTLLEQNLAKHYKIPIEKVRELLATGGIGLFLKHVGGLGLGGAGALGLVGTRGAAVMATRAIPVVAVASTVAWVRYKYQKHIFTKAVEEEYVEAKNNYEAQLAEKKQEIQTKRGKLSEKEQILTSAIYETVNIITMERMKIAELTLGMGDM